MIILRKLLLQNGYPVGIVNYNINEGNDDLRRQQQVLNAQQGYLKR